MSEFTLKLSGEATIPHEAERANLKIVATTDGVNKQAVSDSVLTTAQHIEEMINAIQLSVKNSASSDSRPIAHWNKTSLSTTSWVETVSKPGQPKYDDDEGKQVRKFEARVNFDVRFRDFTALGQFSSRLTALDHCEITSLEWLLLPETRESFVQQLRKNAALDALRRARDYCSVFCNGKDVQIVPFELEAGNEGNSHAYGRHRTVQTARKASASTGGAMLVFTPEEISMTLQIDITFKVFVEPCPLSSLKM